MDFLLYAGEDIFIVIVNFARGEKELYDAMYYMAVLRKSIAVPESLSSLDNEMKGIDWVGLYKARIGDSNQSVTNQLATNAAKILKNLD